MIIYETHPKTISFLLSYCYIVESMFTFFLGEKIKQIDTEEVKGKFVYQLEVSFNEQTVIL